MRRLAILGAIALAGIATHVEHSSAQAVESPDVRLSTGDSDKLRSAGATILFWSQAQRDQNFPAMEKLFPGHIARAGGKVHRLPQGKPLPLDAATIDAYMAAQNVAGLIVLQDGKIRLERYARGYSATGRYTSFSVAKSFSSTLVGAAIRDGYIKSVSEPVTKYIPELAGSGYDGVTIKQLLTMTSGVKWNESYFDPKSDVATMYSKPVPAGVDPTVAYMRTLPRETPPGEKWVYKTGETNLIGVLVTKATGKPLATYLSEKVWKPYGMERDAFWMIDQSGQEIGGCCLSVSLRDYARMGQLVLDGGKGIVPDGWFADATRAQVETSPAYGYGYQWWTYPNGYFGAQGIFGQSIFIDPAKKIVIAVSGAWPKATGDDLKTERAVFQLQVIEAAGK
ncbi:beta-lactamase family protein [Sphingomonas sp. So64.6b]|uniref:serine hydrolase domain-containing protein n=1 Tax=Sphingomonas sp. So64.6b TaxID=2997354 RepID=UPI001600FDCC|nr:serine hydrolase domain-containing protein [Sphingomonas sp. So64.6b]QNA83655.1 beta-lactamase family protein [Sphingomonas sp. So64.6b]